MDLKSSKYFIFIFKVDKNYWVCRPSELFISFYDFNVPIGENLLYTFNILYSSWLNHVIILCPLVVVISIHVMDQYHNKYIFLCLQHTELLNFIFKIAKSF